MGNPHSGSQKRVFTQKKNLRNEKNHKKSKTKQVTTSTAQGHKNIPNRAAVNTGSNSYQHAMTDWGTEYGQALKYT